ncbi:MAG TPA: acyltransferase [Candidatus Dormibacteraeota bacterium]
MAFGLTAAGRGMAVSLRRYPLTHRLWGWWLSRKFTRAGWLACAPGFPKPRVRNLGGVLEAGNCLFFPGVRLEVGETGRLSIGTGTYLNRDTEVIAWKEVSIGRDCMIGWDVLIMDTDQHPIPDRGLDNRPVRIGDRVWIGARATVLKGVNIGDDAVIGAGAIVTHDVPAGAVATGPAAQVVRVPPARSETPDTFAKAFRK